MAASSSGENNADAEIRQYLDTLKKDVAHPSAGAATNLLDGLIAPAAVVAMLALFVWETLLSFSLGFAGGLVVLVFLRVLAEVRETVRVLNHALPEVARLADIRNRMGH